MNKVFCSMLGILCLSATAQTNVGGALFSNTTWNLSGSPYILTSDVQVAPGATLTIAPGVTVQYAGDQEILVKGALIANGTPSQSLYFTGTSGKAMIHFKSCDLSKSQISNASFSGPKYAISLGSDPVENTEILLMTDVFFTKTGITTTGDNTTASIIMEKATLDSTRVIGGYPHGERIEFRNSEIKNSSIESDSYHLGMYLDQCSAKNSTLTTGCCGSSVSITSSNLDNCLIAHNFNYSGRGFSRLKNSTLNNCEIKHDHGTLQMENCLVNHSATEFITMAAGYINCSHISGNGSGTAIHTTGYSDFPHPPVVLHNTRLSNNTTAILLTGSGKINIDSCSFYLNSSYHINNETALNFTLANNFWGSGDSVSIALKVRDFYDNINYGKVKTESPLNKIYLPLSCPDTTGIVTPPPPPPPLPTTLRETAEGHGISIFPNPSSGHLTISSNVVPCEVQLIDHLGRVIFLETLEDKKLEIKVDHLARGFYYCRILAKGSVDVRKVILR